jgi:hypothetical protein
MILMGEERDMYFENENILRVISENIEGSNE